MNDLTLRNITQVVDFLGVCAVLHNLCIDDTLFPNENIVNEHAFGNVEGIEDDDDRDGITRRNSIMNVLPVIL